MRYPLRGKPRDPQGESNPPDGRPPFRFVILLAILKHYWTLVTDWCFHFLHVIGELQPTRRTLAVALAVILLCAGILSVSPLIALSQTKPVTLSEDGLTAQVLTRAQTVAELVNEYGIVLEEGDVIAPALSQSLNKGDMVKLRRAIDVNVTADGQNKAVRMLTGTVGEALYLAGVTLDVDDEVFPSRNTPVTAGMEIQVSRVEVYTEYEEKGIPYQVTYQEDASMYVGKEKVARQGQEGVQQLQMRVVMRDGVEVERTVVGERILEAAQNRLVSRGVKPVPTPTPKPSATKKPSSTSKPSATKKPSSTSKATPDPNKKNESNVTDNTITVDGKTYQFERKLSMMLTAYTHTGRKTSTGTWPAVGTIAVDPSVIPYGTKLFVPGYGFGTAADTGPTGNHIDLFFNTEAECVKFGRKRDKTVYILSN